MELTTKQREYLEKQWSKWESSRSNELQRYKQMKHMYLFGMLALFLQIRYPTSGMLELVTYATCWPVVFVSFVGMEFARKCYVIIYRHYNADMKAFHTPCYHDEIVLDRSIVNFRWTSWGTIFSCSKIALFLYLQYAARHEYMLTASIYSIIAGTYFLIKIRGFTKKRIEGIEYDAGTILSKDGKEMGKFLYTSS